MATNNALKHYPVENGIYKKQKIKAVKSSEFRAPRKGEYYLSGCKGWEMAYQAANDLSTAFRIMYIIEV